VGTFAGLVGSLGTIGLTLWLSDNDHFEITKAVGSIAICSTFVITALLAVVMFVVIKKSGDLWKSRKTANN